MLASVFFTMALAQAAAGGAASAPVQPHIGPAPVVVAKANDDDKVSCRVEASTGSLIAEKTCHTNRQWRQMSEDAQDVMRNRGQYDAQGTAVGH